MRTVRTIAVVGTVRSVPAARTATITHRRRDGRDPGCHARVGLARDLRHDPFHWQRRQGRARG